MILVSKQGDNSRLTFHGLVMQAFNCHDQKSVSVNPLNQNVRQGYGTVKVDGVAYDWFDRGDRIDFILAI